MTLTTIRGYTLTRNLRFDGSNPYLGISPDGLPVFIRLSAAPIPNPSAAEAVLQFLRRYRQLDHPSLIRIRDWWIEEGYLRMVTDLADGGSLKDRLRQQRSFASRDLVSLLRPLGAAIDFLHSQGIRHRDIRPTNLLLHRAVPQLDVPRLQSIRFANFVYPSYSAPEVVRNEDAQQSDQYSLAAAYVELRLGRPIFSTLRNDGVSTIRALLEQEPDLEPLPEGEREAVRKALAKDSAQRYATCLTFVEALERSTEPPEAS